MTAAATATATTSSAGNGPPASVASQQADAQFSVYTVPAGSRPHDVAPAADGRLWYTAQGAAALGILDPETATTRHVSLGQGSAPHGVIVGPDGSAWVTDGGLNSIVRVDPSTFEAATFPLPRPANANLNTAAFDGNRALWFTGQSGVYGRVDPATGKVEVFEAPRGRGPYGITTTPDGAVWFASLAGSYISRIGPKTAEPTVVDVPTTGGGARRIWSDSSGGLWVTEWFAGNLAHYDPATQQWREWRLPGDDPRPYAVYVDEKDAVWVTDFAANSLVRFDPRNERFHVFPFPIPDAQVRQLLGREGEIWGAGSATDTLFVLRTR
ncbi:MAG: lyase [Nitriliruptorales bacterium]